MRKMLCATALLTLGAAGVYFANQNMQVEIVTAPAPPATRDVPPPIPEVAAPVARPTPEAFEPILVETSPSLDDVRIRSAGETVGMRRDVNPRATATAPRPDTTHARRMPYADEAGLSWLAELMKSPLESILTSHDSGSLPRGVFGGEEESEEWKRER